MSKKRTLHSYFTSTSSPTPSSSIANKKRSKLATGRPTSNPYAEALAQRLDTDANYLTEDGASWYLLKRKWLASKGDDKDDNRMFDNEWNLHPTKRHNLKLFGKTVQEKRWSQTWGVSYSYSGSTNVALPIPESSMVERLIRTANELTADVIDSVDKPYNGCLQNWYQPEDTIGLHSDDERSQRTECPIFSLSWGGTRRFLFRWRGDKKQKTELLLKDGDLLVMGGTCQKTHYHEVPKLRKTMDAPTTDRINWTVRAFHDTDKK